MPSLATQLMRSGIGSPAEIAAWIARGDVQLGGQPAQAEQELQVGDTITVRGAGFAVRDVSGKPRLLLQPMATPSPTSIPGLRRVHCGLHKCLTMYIRNILQRVSDETSRDTHSFRHFFHRADEFYRECDQYDFSSISGHAIDLDRFENVRVSRFIRDPRDLLVSGYFYHRRGAEHWANYRDPQPEEWEVINAPIPESLPAGTSLTEHLQNSDMEQGLLTEIEFRRYHFDSMRQWPEKDERVRCYRYEDIVGNEARVFRDLLRFYEVPWLVRRRGVRWAVHFSAARREKQNNHIRDPSSGQWHKYFTPLVERRFEEEYGELLEILGYR